MMVPRLRLRTAMILVAAAIPAIGADAPKNVLRDLGPIQGANGKILDPTPAADGATVLIFLSTECPIANASSPALNKLHDAFPPPRVKWIGVCVDPDKTDAEVVAHARDYRLKLDVAVDPRGRLARKLGATVTPEAFVIDPRGKVRYHGRIDDQFAARGIRNARPEGHELNDALAAILAGEEVKIPHAEAVGCPIPEVDDDAQPAK